MFKRILGICISFLIVFVGCGNNKTLLNEDFPIESIDKIQFVTAMGNPAYGAESKIITDEQEILLIMQSLHTAVIGKKIDSDDILIGFCSEIYLYSGDEVVQTLRFNVNDTEAICVGEAVYKVSYEDKTPMEIYKESKAEVIIVDENLNPMVRPE